jgi:hypothetical protein
MILVIKRNRYYNHIIESTPFVISNTNITAMRTGEVALSMAICLQNVAYTTITKAILLERITA